MRTLIRKRLESIFRLSFPGWEGEFFKSSNIDGGDEYNAALLENTGK